MITTNPVSKNFTRASLVLAAFALTTIVGCAATRTQESTGQYVDDTTLTTKVKAAIFNEPMLKSMEINVETFKGRVQLSGFVNTAEEKARAEQVARGVSGVQNVQNNISVK